MENKEPPSNPIMTEGIGEGWVEKKEPPSNPIMTENKWGRLGGE